MMPALEAPSPMARLIPCVGGMPVRLDAAKVRPFGSHVLWAGTGSQGCSQRVEAAIAPQADDYGPGRTSEEISLAIHERANQVQLASIQSFVNYGQQAHPELWGGIFCDWAINGPWIMEIDLNGGWQFNDPFAGSGCAFAHLAFG
jgi:hypothetical protein